MKKRARRIFCTLLFFIPSLSPRVRVRAGTITPHRQMSFDPYAAGEPAPAPQPSTSLPSGGPGCVLLVALEHGHPTGTPALTLDLLHALFSPHATVHKAALFDKGGAGAGGRGGGGPSQQQGLVQLRDAAGAAAARAALDGRPLPSALAAPASTPPTLRLSPSVHTNLNVRSQSWKTRDFLDASLPVEGGGGGGGEAPGGAPGGAPPQPPPHHAHAPPPAAHAAYAPPATPGNVLQCTFENAAYPVSAAALHAVFSPYGRVLRVLVFDRQGVTNALVQFPSREAAAGAAAALDGHAIYAGGFNVLRASISRRHVELQLRQTGERAWDFGAFPAGPPGEGAVVVSGAGAAGCGPPPPPPPPPPGAAPAGPIPEAYGGYGGGGGGGGGVGPTPPGVPPLPPGGGGYEALLSPSVAASASASAPAPAGPPIAITGADYEAAHAAAVAALTAAGGGGGGGRGGGGPRPRVAAGGWGG